MKMMKTLSLAFCSFCFCLLAAGQTAPLWIRYPAISPDGKTIVFSYRGDLYLVPSGGGTATPLTMNEGHDFMPVWSRDSRQIAFASYRYGNFDLFLTSIEGGEPRRLTYHSSPEFPYAFTPDDSAVLFGASRLDSAASRTFPVGYQPELYQVSVQGGRVEQILTTPAEAVNLSRDGQRMLYEDRKGGENAWRKHHTSAVARDIWVLDRKTSAHTRLTAFAGEDRNPVFAEEDRFIYYLSEESGSSNVRRMPAQGGASQAVTSFSVHPVRFLSVSCQGLLCFGYDGEIYTQKGNARPQKVPIRLAAEARINREKIFEITGGAREFAVSPNGKEIAFVARGEVFAAGVDGGATKQITRTPEAECSVSFSADGKALLYASERGNRWKIYESRRTRDEEPYFYASTVLRETALIDNDRENTQPLFSPDGKEIAFVEDRTNLKVFHTESRQSRTLLTDRELFSMQEGDQYFQWGPDGKWILFNYSIPGLAPTEIGLIAADGTGKAVNLSRSGFNDSRGQWILGGKAILWFSNRDGLKSVAQSGSAQEDVYALFLTRQAWDRFRLSKDEAALLKEAEEKKEKEKAEAAKEKKETGKEAKEKESKPEPLAIDWDSLELRKARLTIHSSTLSDALVNKDGDMLYYLARFEKGVNLWSTHLRTRETKMVVALNADRASMQWDKEQKSLFLLADGSLSKIDPAGGKKEPIAMRGEMTSDQAAERRLAFGHVWRRTRATFYTAGFHGADWDRLHADYEKYLPHLADSHDFAEMLSEMLGELNVSHSGASFNPHAPGSDETASLGFFYDSTSREAGLKIEEVLKNGPMDSSGFDIRPGMVLEAVDGETITAEKDLPRYLNRKAGKRILLRLADGDKKRELSVKPISLEEERALLYRRWVRRNQEETERLSQGRLGYIHVPGMNDSAYRTAYEEVMGRYGDRQAIVVDTRFNNGGDLVSDLAMFLSGKKFFDYVTDTRSFGYEPNFRWTRPSIALANEANYSDGHCFAYAYQELKLGSLVGMPVPGTCTWAGWEVLADSPVRWGVPPLGVKNSKGKYLENSQTTPDIEVRNEPEALSRGRDQQLEAAIQALLTQIRR